MNALPSQSRFIIGTEACERFSFYGMKSILMLFGACMFIIGASIVFPAFFGYRI